MPTAARLRHRLTTVAFLISFVGFFACSQQKRFVERIADADHAIFAYNFEDFSMPLTDDEIKQVTQAVANGRKLNPDGLACSPEARIEFFKGSQRLAAITNCVEVFWIDGTPYENRSGTLRSINQRGNLRKRSPGAVNTSVTPQR